VQHFALVTVEPLEQVNRDVATVGEAAPKLLRAVNMRIDQPGNDELAACLDGLFGPELRRDIPGRSDRNDAIVLDCDRTIPEDTPLRIHRDHPVRVLDENLGWLRHNVPHRCRYEFNRSQAERCAMKGTGSRRPDAVWRRGQAGIGHLVRGHAPKRRITSHSTAQTAPYSTNPTMHSTNIAAMTNAVSSFDPANRMT
jgi:hypothetical protein